MTVLESSLFDPPATSAMTAAADWVTMALTGTIATVIAVLAIAVVGVLMLRGRIDWRRGGLAVLGCFVLFGARDIATGLYGRDKTFVVSMDRLPPPEPTLILPVAPEPMAPSVYDPYAGAAVPQR